MANVFQTTVQYDPAPGVEGDFASENARAQALGQPLAGLSVAGSTGVTVGKFAFDIGNFNASVITGSEVYVNSLSMPVSAGNTTANSFAALWQANGAGIGFIHREQQALITSFLSNASLVIPQGYGVIASVGGDYWARFSAGTLANGLGLYSGGATKGQRVWANYVDGSCISSPDGTPPTGGTTTSASGSSTTLTIAGTITGYFAAGQPLQATTGVSAGIYIVAQLTGTPGGAGTYLTSAATTISTAALTSTAGYETQFAVASTCAAGEIAKITTWRW
jgi:hypothetical protein